VVTVVEYLFGPVMENVAPAREPPSLAVLAITIAPTPSCGSVKGGGAFGVPLAQVAGWSTTTVTGWALSSA
jgi:hypothetical protein